MATYRLYPLQNKLLVVANPPTISDACRSTRFIPSRSNYRVILSRFSNQSPQQINRQEYAVCRQRAIGIFPEFLCVYHGRNGKGQGLHRVCPSRGAHKIVKVKPASPVGLHGSQTTGGDIRVACDQAKGRCREAFPVTFCMQAGLWTANGPRQEWPLWRGKRGQLCREAVVVQKRQLLVRRIHEVACGRRRREKLSSIAGSRGCCCVSWGRERDSERRLAA